MADVQLEDGFAQIALLLAGPLIGQHFTDAARAILVELVCGHYGPLKMRDVPLTPSEVSDRSGCHVKSVTAAFTWLTENNVIEEARSFVWRLKKDFDRWKCGDPVRRRRQAQALLDVYGGKATHKRRTVAKQLPKGSAIATHPREEGSAIATHGGDMGSAIATPPHCIEDRASEELRLENKQQTLCAGVSPFNDLADEMCRIIGGGAVWPTGEANDDVAVPLRVSLDQHKPSKAAAVCLAYQAKRVARNPISWLLSMSAQGNFKEPSRPLTPEGKLPPERVANAAAYRPAERIRDDTTPEDREAGLRIINAKLGRSNGHSVKGA